MVITRDEYYELRNSKIKLDYENGLATKDIANKYELSVRLIQMLARNRRWKRKVKVKKEKMSYEEKLLKPQQVYIYAIEFDENKIYIGQTKNIGQRMRVHIYDAIKERHSSRFINKITKENGEEYIKNKFSKPRIIYTNINGNKSIANEKEKYYQIKYLDLGYELLGGIY